MMLKVTKTDNTSNQRQARRREREKQWLKENGWNSWEALHTELMNGAVILQSGAANEHHALNNQQVSETMKQK